MKASVYLLAMFFCLAGVNAQPPAVNVQGLKIAFVTKHLNLSADESQKFWPVYYDYTNELKQARQEQKTVDVLVFEERVLNIRKKYRAEFKKILGTDVRANKALTAEKDFGVVVKQELMKRAEMRKKRNNGGNF